MRRCAPTCASSCSAARRGNELLSCSSTCSGIRPSRQHASWACVPRPFGPSRRRVDERSEERKERGMPDVQEVFRLATNKVKPDPNALERQQQRQRASTRSTPRSCVPRRRRGDRGDRDRACWRSRGRPTSATRHPAGRPPPDHPHVRHGASLRRGRANAGDRGSAGPSDGEVTGLPVDAFAPSVSADGSTIAFVAAPSELGYNQIGVVGADGSDPHFISTPHVIVGAHRRDLARCVEGRVRGVHDGQRRHLRRRTSTGRGCDS